MVKVCSCCGRAAEFSLVMVISSVGISKRVQQCSGVVLFCDPCLQNRLAGGHWGSDKMRECVNNAYTQINRRLNERSI